MTGQAAAGQAGGRRVLLGLIGYPIKHSASPAMHEAAAAALGWQGFYHLIEVAGADRLALTAMLDGVRRLGFSGVNVTFPYKEAVVPLLDDLSPAAARLGAVNTVVVREGRLIGHNTDTTGFLRAVRGLVEASGHGPVALVGAGGVGKAAALALADAGVREIRVFDRDPEKTAVLRAMLGERLIAADTVEAAVAGAVGLVNGTPVGMSPNTDSPVPPSLLHAGLWVADAVYSPLWTPLLLAAKAAGAKVMTGRDLAINQAVDAFTLFTGAEPSVAVMAEAFEAVMARRRGGAAA